MSVLTLELAVPGVLKCASCGGEWYRGNGKPYVLTGEGAAGMRGYLAAGGLAVLVFHLDQVVYVDPTLVVPAPGRAVLHRCSCDRGMFRGERCDICAGTGIELYHACPRCGDTAMWRYEADRGHMRCDACGERWDAAHPGWIAQRVPDRLLAAAS